MHPGFAILIILAISLLVTVIIRGSKNQSKPEVADVVPDEGAAEYIKDLLSSLQLRMKLTVVGTRLSKGKLWTIGDELLLLTDPINEVEEGEFFEGEQFFRVLILREAHEEYLYVHQASGEYVILSQEHRGVSFIPEEIQPIHVSLVEPSPDEEETREDGTNEGAEYEGTQEGVKQNVKGKHDDWDHHHASYP